MRLGSASRRHLCLPMVTNIVVVAIIVGAALLVTGWKMNPLATLLWSAWPVTVGILLGRQGSRRINGLWFALLVSPWVALVWVGISEALDTNNHSDWVGSWFEFYVSYGTGFVFVGVILGLVSYLLVPQARD
jgi:hypothetical protein